MTKQQKRDVVRYLRQHPYSVSVEGLAAQFKVHPSDLDGFLIPLIDLGIVQWTERPYRCQWVTTKYRLLTQDGTMHEKVFNSREAAIAYNRRNDMVYDIIPD